MNKFKREFFTFMRGLLFNCNAVEMSLTMLLFWWAFILYLPVNTFSEATAYEPMSSVASENVWATGILIIGFYNLIGTVTKHRKTRMMSNLVSMGLWLFVATMFFMGDQATTATGTYLIISLLNGYVFFKVGDVSGRNSNISNRKC